MKASLFLVISLFSLLLASCENYNDKDVALSDSTSITGLTGDSIKLVKTGSLNIKVKDIEQSTRAVSSLAQKLGGMIFIQSLEYQESGRKELRNSTDSITIITALTPQADIKVRVPSGNLEEFMFDVSDLGYFTRSSDMHIDDQSLRYLENSLKQRNRTETLLGRASKRDTTLTTSQAIQIYDAAIEQQIQNRSISADANYSVVNLSLYQNPTVTREVVANSSLADYQLPFSQRLVDSLENGWKYFLEFILVLANLWIFILVSIMALLFYQHWHHRRKIISLDVRGK